MTSSIISSRNRQQPYAPYNQISSRQSIEADEIIQVKEKKQLAKITGNQSKIIFPLKNYENKLWIYHILPN